jgi:hypothetical protein
MIFLISRRELFYIFKLELFRAELFKLLKLDAVYKLTISASCVIKEKFLFISEVN